MEEEEEGRVGFKDPGGLISLEKKLFLLSWKRKNTNTFEVHTKEFKFKS